jgi:hypothetical protein
VNSSGLEKDCETGGVSLPRVEHVLQSRGHTLPSLVTTKVQRISSAPPLASAAVGYLRLLSQRRSHTEGEKNQMFKNDRHAVDETRTVEGGRTGPNPRTAPCPSRAAEGKKCSVSRAKGLKLENVDLQGRRQVSAADIAAQAPE